MAEASEKEPPGGLPLETMGDIRRAMADVCRRLRDGSMPVGQGNALTQSLNTLYGMHADARDNQYKKRVRTLWQAYEKQQSQPMDGPH